MDGMANREGSGRMTTEEIEKILYDIDSADIYEDYVKSMKIVKEALEKQQWIPCSEGMPEEHDTIFAKLKGTDKWNRFMFEKTSNDVNVTIEYSTGERKTEVLHTKDGKWSQPKRKDVSKVIAWMPLPEPYKEKE